MTLGKSVSLSTFLLRNQLFTERFVSAGGILLMDDFKARFASCDPGVALADCKFGVYREGAIVSLLSIGTLIGALTGVRGPYRC